MRRLAMAAMFAGALMTACGGGGYSEDFRAQFLSSCESSSGGQAEYCQCVLDHLEANGPDDENDITVENQTAAITACAGEVTG